MVPVLSNSFQAPLWSQVLCSGSRGQSLMLIPLAVYWETIPCLRSLLLL